MVPFDWDAYMVLKLAGVIWFFLAGCFILKSFKVPLLSACVFLGLVVLSGFMMSKTWYILQHVFGREGYPYDHLNEAWTEAGSVLYGWILGGALALWAGAPLVSVSWRSLFDRLAPHMLVAQILNRIGCFLAGCCWGDGPCALPWAVYNEFAEKKVHPVQLYEAAFDILLLVILMGAARRRRYSVAVIYFAGYAIGRFFLEFFRGDNGPALLFFTVPQLTSILIIVFVLLIYKKSLTRP